jgi:putative transposase
LTLYYLDECGFSPSQPVSWSWTLRGRRKRLPYENPQGKRVNALAALRVSGSAEVDWDLFRRTLQADDLLAFLRTLPREPGTPLVVVLDNASIHKNRVVKAALPALWRERIYLYYLPPYSPELNRIERRPSQHRDTGPQPQTLWEYHDRHPRASAVRPGRRGGAPLHRAG